MIELSEELCRAVLAQPEGPVRLVDPSTKQAFVLLRAEEYERLTRPEYDDGPWTEEEMTLLAQENADRLGWEGMEDYQDDRP